MLRPDCCARWMTALALLISLAACKDDSEAGDTGSDDATGDGDDGGILDAPPEGEGIQFSMTTILPPGSESEKCLFVQGPAEKIFINRDEVRYSPGSHHFLLYETNYTEIPTEKEDGTPVDTSGVFNCSDGPTDGWDIRKLIGGSQNGEGDSIISFPPTVAVEVQANRVLLMNAHYINALDDELEPEVAINLWTIPEDEVTELGDVLFIYNPLIRAPVNQMERARWQCPVHRDITLTNVQSHMHARGVNFVAQVMGESEPFYENTEWEYVEVGVFADGLQIPAGSTLDYYCEYINAGPEAVYQGSKSTDEMCMLIGSFYPADSLTANCQGPDGEQFGGVWVGNGTATCNATLGCLTGAFGSDEPLKGITDCILDADPAVAAEVSAMFSCFVEASSPQAECAEELATCQSL